MDRISSAAEQALAPQVALAAAPATGPFNTLIKVAVSCVPWIIIAGLLWAGLFIKPQPVGGTVQPPVIERRDHFFGLAAAPAGGLWVAWPKKTSGVATDLSFDRVQRVGLDCGLVDNKVAAIDDTWSGLRFVKRVQDR